MNNSGYEEVRDAVAESLNKRFDTNFIRENIIMTAGAAGGLNCVLRTLLNYRDEVICFAPFFGEYRSYISNFGGDTAVVPASTTSRFNWKVSVSAGTTAVSPPKFEI